MPLGIYSLSPKQAAKLLNVSVAAIYRAVQAKAGLRAHRWGGAMRILVKDAFRDGEDYQRLVVAASGLLPAREKAGGMNPGFADFVAAVQDRVDNQRAAANADETRPAKAEELHIRVAEGEFILRLAREYLMQDARG